jgi:hypothetical protein
MLWFRVEILAFFGNLYANVIFMFLRSIRRVQIDPGSLLAEEAKQQRIDTILALHTLA